jgi:hypothetical protein
MECVTVTTFMGSADTNNTSRETSGNLSSRSADGCKKEASKLMYEVTLLISIWNCLVLLSAMLYVTR